MHLSTHKSNLKNEGISIYHRGTVLPWHSCATPVTPVQGTVYANVNLEESSNEAINHLNSCGENAWLIGEVVQFDGEQVVIK